MSIYFTLYKSKSAQYPTVLQQLPYLCYDPLKTKFSIIKKPANQLTACYVILTSFLIDWHDKLLVFILWYNQIRYIRYIVSELSSALR